MADFLATMANPASITTEAQIQAGKAIGGDMDAEHKNFVETVSKLLESGAIDEARPESFLNQSVYDGLSDEWKAKTDQVMVNMAILLKHIHDFYRSKQTPDACPQLATMIEQLWEMKQRIEIHADAFKF